MRIGYVCKYVPAEALEAMGAHMERIEPDESLVSFDAAESCMHANVCSFAKATFETVLSGNLDGIVLTTCCDSMRRLADALRTQAPNLFIHVLDVPRDTGEAACALYQRRVAELLSASLPMQRFRKRSCSPSSAAPFALRKALATRP